MKLSVRLNVSAAPDQTVLSSLCPQASLSNQPAICFKGSQGVSSFAYSPQCLGNSILISSDLLPSASVTLPPRVLFDSYGPRCAVTLFAFSRWVWLVVCYNFPVNQMGCIGASSLEQKMGAARPLLALPAGLRHIYQPVGPVLKGAALIPARADCADKSDFARHTNAVPVHSTSPETGRHVPPGC